MKKDSILEKAQKAIAKTAANGSRHHVVYMDFKNERNETVYVVDCGFNEEAGTVALCGTDICICGIRL